MKKIILFILISTLFFSCKKEEQFKPDEHIAYTHWYKTRSGSVDTLFSVYIPNAFTPNGDGINDDFYPEGYFYLKNFKILSKENNLIYETTDINGHWDGKNHGTPTQIGTYVYKLNISDGVGNQYEYTGSVTIYR